MSVKLSRTSQFMCSAAILTALFLQACAGDADQPEMKADETWQYMQEVRDKPLAPEEDISEEVTGDVEGPAAALPPVSQQEILSADQAGVQLAQLEQRYTDIEPEISGFTRELGQSLQKIEASTDEMRRQEYWRGAQLALSRLADRQARLDMLLEDCLSLGRRLMAGSEVSDLLGVLLGKSQSLSARTRELMRTAEQELAVSGS
ncbi:hypothetical protein [Emcibacter sp.]|uniref:hypothetical protein n=1 Tax=Emcibacter sp. TaxID=1979954 RepID=UPI003A917BA3